jgi:hypothetical protein
MGPGRGSGMTSTGFREACLQAERNLGLRATDRRIAPLPGAPPTPRRYVRRQPTGDGPQGARAETAPTHVLQPGRARQSGRPTSLMRVIRGQASSGNQIREARHHTGLSTFASPPTGLAGDAPATLEPLRRSSAGVPHMNPCYRLERGATPRCRCWTDRLRILLLDQLGGIWEIIFWMTLPEPLPTVLKRSL